MPDPNINRKLMPRRMHSWCVWGDNIFGLQVNRSVNVELIHQLSDHKCNLRSLHRLGTYVDSLKLR